MVERSAVERVLEGDWEHSRSGLRQPSRSAHRPLFLLAGVAAVIGGCVWLLPVPVQDPVALHLNWLLLGMADAAVAGYLLTALPSWARGERAPVWVVWVIVALWVAARALRTVAPDTALPYAFTSVALHGTLTVVLVRPLLRLRVWSRCPLALAPALLGAADLAALGLWDTAWQPGSLPMVLLLAALISLIGGRALPAFTAAARGRPSSDVAVGSHHLPVILVLLAIGLVAHEPRTAGALLMAAGCVQLGRVALWTPWRSHSPAVLMLHLAWAWLGIGLLLLGVALLLPMSHMSVGTALHALTMGAMGSMIYAFASRATMRRTDDGLRPTPVQLVGFALVLASPLPRLVPWPGPMPMTGYALAVVAWTVGWGCLIARMAREVREPAPWPVLSASRRTPD